MRRILSKFLESYSHYAIRSTYNWWFGDSKDTDAIARLMARKRFLPPEQVTEAFSHQVRFHCYMQSTSISPINKLLLLSGFRGFNNGAALKAVRSCSTLFPTEYSIGGITLTLSEITSMLYIILKKYYLVKNQCDMKYYLRHLTSYIPWQSLTHTLKRFPTTKERKQILNTIGMMISTYVETESSIRREVAISIW